MENKVITVQELINQLEKFDKDKPVIISAVGFNGKDSWDAPLDFGDETVDEFNHVVRINFSLYG